MGEERIANKLQLKLGIGVSPRTLEKYLRSGDPRRIPDPKQRWFIHNHAKVIVACDFFVAVIASFRTLYVFAIMELGTRRILHQNVVMHSPLCWQPPTALLVMQTSISPVPCLLAGQQSDRSLHDSLVQMGRAAGPVNSSRVDWIAVYDKLPEPESTYEFFR